MNGTIWEHFFEKIKKKYGSLAWYWKIKLENKTISPKIVNSILANLRTYHGIKLLSLHSSLAWDGQNMIIVEYHKFF